MLTFPAIPHFRSLALTLCCLAPLASGTALAQEGVFKPFMTGAQICQPMNLDIALKGLQWRSEGSLNNFSESLWVVCPIHKDPFNENMDVLGRLVNFSDTAAEVHCLFKVTTALGQTVRSRSGRESVPAQATASIFTDNIPVAFDESLSVSCNLPPQTGILHFIHASY